MPTGPLGSIQPVSRQCTTADFTLPIEEERNDVPEISGTLSRTGRGADAPHPGIHQVDSKRLDIFMSLAYAAIGFSPITALAVAIIGILPLPTATLLLVWPSLVLGISLAFLFPYYGKLALKGLAIGLIAVFLYDCMRVPFIIAGVWGDFIPKISIWLLNTPQPNWLVGYLWRYIGDGGFMGMAFTVAYCLIKPRVNVRIAALAFGIGIWLCLIATLGLAPHAGAALFKLTPTSFSLSLLGHIIYGASIGLFLPYFFRAKGRTF
ncbi:MAG: hypothetical protein JO125_08785 [Chloroflexi bacterium]|nr:hypothetical protein [Chloroflexota bacterium]